MNKKLLAVCAAVILLLSGCGRPSIINAPQPAQKKEKEEIVFWHTYSEFETKVLEREVIPSFEKVYPAYDVVPVRQAYNEQLKYTLIGRTSAGRVPDIMRMDIVWVPYFAERNLLYPISMFADFSDTASVLRESPLTSSKYKEVYYGLPLNINTKAAIYNKQQLEQAGSSRPPETMEELLRLVKKQDGAIEISGLAAWETLPYFYGLGGQLLDQTNQRASGFLNSLASIEAVDTLKELYKQGDLTIGQLGGEPNRWANIVEGKSFMIDEGPWFYSIQLSRIKEITNQTIAAPFPSAFGSVLGGENLVMSQKTKQPKAAWAFMKWMVGKEAQTQLLRTGLFPANQEVDLEQFTKQYPYYKSYVEGLQQAFLRPEVPDWDAVDQIFIKHLTMIFRNEIETEEALTKAANEIDQLLKEGKKQDE